MAYRKRRTYKKAKESPTFNFWHGSLVVALVILSIILLFDYFNLFDYLKGLKEEPTVDVIPDDDNNVDIGDDNTGNDNTGEDLNPDIPSEDNLNLFKTLSLRNGSATYNEETNILTTGYKTLMVSSETFDKGTLSAEIKCYGHDSGLIICLDDGGYTNFWEQSGVKYYYFYIEHSGHLNYVSIIDGVWSFDSVIEIENFDPNGTYKLRVELSDKDSWNKRVDCFLNDEFINSMIYSNGEFLDGIKWGVRTYNKADFINLEIKEEISNLNYYESYSFEDLSINFGSISSNNGVLSTTTRTLFTNSTKPFETGSLSVDVVPKGNDSGIVLALDNSGLSSFWEENSVSYYFLFISFNGYFYLGKVQLIDGNMWRSLNSVKIENFNSDSIYNIKVETEYLNENKTSREFKCYLNDNLSFTYVDTSALTGSGWGIRTGGTSEFSNLVIDSRLSK